MLITDKIIYLQLQKTGCMHTRRILADMYKENHMIIGDHNTLDEVPKRVLKNIDDKLKIGNIRNPWDWYVSLWAFGCQNRGGLFERLTNQKVSNKSGFKSYVYQRLGIEYPKLNESIWTELYSDNNNFENFNAWLKLILSENNHGIGEKYKKKELSNFAGLLTFRYLNLYTNRKKINTLKNAEELKAFDSNENFIDIMLKNEELHEDIIGLSTRLNYSKEKLNVILKKYSKRTNKSLRQRDYRLYYDDESIQLVEKYDKLIIEKYNYTF